MVNVSKGTRTDKTNRTYSKKPECPAWADLLQLGKGLSPSDPVRTKLIKVCQQLALGILLELGNHPRVLKRDVDEIDALVRVQDLVSQPS